MKIYRACIVDVEGDTRFLSYHTTENGAFEAVKQEYETDDEYENVRVDGAFPSLPEFTKSDDVDEVLVPDFPFDGWTIAIDSIDVVED